MTTAMLEVRGLAKRFDRRAVLTAVNLSVRPAEHLALVGNNGQGKTTLIRLILGLIAPDAGEVRLDGEVLRYPRVAAQKRWIGYLPESVSFYSDLSGRRTLDYLGRLKGLRGPPLGREVASLLERMGLAEAADRPLRVYSKGMRQRLGLAQSLLGSPRLLLLDEPTNGLDPDGIHEFYDILAGLQREGVAILMASHILAEIEPRLDRLAVLRDGVIAREGSIAQLSAELQLPTTIKFTLRDARQDLPEELARLVAQAQTNGVAQGYQLRVDDAHRFQVLADMVRHPEHVVSLSVHEPGLEELFRHLNSSSQSAPGDPGTEEG